MSAVDPDLTQKITTQLLLDVDILWLSGKCPVQAEGVVNGHEFYFRARGQAWRLEIYPKGFGFVTGHGHPDTWYYEQAYPKGPFEAGFMEDQEARAFIYYAAERWARERLVD